VLAALIPALKASHEEPASAVRRRPPVSGFSHVLVQVGTSGLLIVVGLLCLTFQAQLPARFGTHGCLILVILGLLLLTPLLSAVLALGVRPVVRRCLGIESRLAADNLVRSPGRTGLVITALAAGVGMVLQTAGFIRSNEDVVLTWMDENVIADLFVTAGSPVSGGGQTMQFQDSVKDELARIDPDAIEGVLPIRYRKIDFHNKQVFLTALDTELYARASKNRHPLPGDPLFPLLREPGTPRVIVSDNFAALYHVKAGDTIEIRGPDGPLTLLVVGSVVDYSWL
jgi:putative ABC transport system permease protein